jgi:hypothetical protein
MNHEALMLVAKTYMAMLKSNYPEQGFSIEKDVNDEKYVIAIPYEDYCIVDVNASVCGRFEAACDGELADMASEYGISMELAHCLLAVNRYLKSLQ